MTRHRSLLAWWHSIVLMGCVVSFGLPESTQTPCQISLLIPFHDERTIDSNNSSTVVTQANHQRDGLTLLATALLAIQDFNNRSSLIAPTALDAISKQCPLFFPPPTITDSGHSAEIIRAKESSWVPTNTTCSIIIGPQDNLAAQAVGQLLRGTEMLAISYGATADELASSLYPNLALGTVKWENRVRTLFHYLKAIRKDDVGILLRPEDNLDFNNSDFVPMWTRVSRLTGVQINSFSRVDNRSSSLFKERLLTLRDARSVKTIVVTLHRDDNIEVLAEIADELGMLTDEYSWILMDSFLSPRYVSNFQVTASSPIARLFERSEMFQILDGLSPYFVRENRNDSLLLQTVWRSQSADLVDQMNSLLNQTVGFESIIIDQQFLEREFFDSAPAQGASLIYDAILKAGISACNDEENIVESGNLCDVAFDGVSGKYEFDECRSLKSDGLQFAVYSIHKTIDNSTNMVTFAAELIHQTSNGDWNIELKSGNPTLSREATIVGFTFAGIALAFSSFCGAFVFYFRKDIIVSIGQPEFLYMVCFGSFLLALPIILMSFDEGSGWTDGMLNASCTGQAWLKYFGILTVNMALFSKLYRVEKVTQIRRGRRVEVKEVIKPFVILIVLAFVALIVWTILEPPEWRREEGLAGFCYETWYYGIGMDAAMIITISITLWWARKTRDLPEEISDSGRVYQTLVAQFVLLMFDIIVLRIIVSFNDHDFAYISNVIITFALSISCAAYLMLPKMYYVWRKERTGEMPRSLQLGIVRVSGISEPENGLSATSRHGGFSQNRIVRSTAQSGNDPLRTLSV